MTDRALPGSPLAATPAAPFTATIARGERRAGFVPPGAESPAGSTLAQPVAGEVLSLLGDALALVCVVFAVPFAILLIGLPVVLLVRVVLAIVQRLG